MDIKMANAIQCQQVKSDAQWGKKKKKKHHLILHKQIRPELAVTDQESDFGGKVDSLIKM